MVEKLFPFFDCSGDRYGTDRINRAGRKVGLRITCRRMVMLAVFACLPVPARAETVFSPSAIAPGDFRIDTRVEFSDTSDPFRMVVLTGSKSNAVTFSLTRDGVFTAGKDGKAIRSIRVPDIASGVPVAVMIRRRGDDISAVINRIPVMDIASSHDTAGKLGVVIDDSPPVISNMIYRKLTPILYTDNFSRLGGADLGFEQTGAAKWKISGDAHASMSANPFRLIGTAPADAGNTSTLTFGKPYWNRYIFELSAKPATGTTFGIGCDAESGDGVTISARKADQTGAAHTGASGNIALDVNDSAGVVTRDVLTITQDTWIRVRAVVFDGDIFFSIDGIPVARTTAKTLFFGKTRIRLVTGRIEIDDVSVTSVPADFDPTSNHAKRAAAEILTGRPPTIAKNNIGDRGMKSWASLSTVWRLGRGGMFVSTQPYFNDATIFLEQDGGIRGMHVLGLHVNGWRKATETLSGCFLDIVQPDAKSDTIQLTLRNGDQVVARQKLDRAPHRIALSVITGTSTLAITADGRPVIRTEVKDMPVRGRATYKGAGDLMRPDVYILSPNAVDETFGNAPVKWMPLSGQWRQMSMWECMPRSAWYSANVPKDQRLAANSFKYDISGDVWINIYFALPMRGDQTPYYDFPFNLGVSFTDDSGDPDSGETVLFGGVDLPVKLFYKGKQQADNRSFLVPNIRYKQGNLIHQLHTRFFNLIITRKDGKMSVYGDGRRLINKVPVDSKNAKRLILWTLDNGLIFTRVRISAEALTHETVAPVIPTSRLESVARQMVYGKRYREFDRAVDMLRAPVTIPDSYRRPIPFLPASGFMSPGPFEIAPGDYGGYDGVRVALLNEHSNATTPDTKHFSSVNGAVRIINRNLGSPMEVTMVGHPFSIAAYPILQFDYRLSRKTVIGLSINYGYDFKHTKTIYLNHPKIFSKKSARRSSVPLITDEKWHRVRVDLEKFLAGAPGGFVREIRLFSPTFESNVRGDWIDIDNVILMTRLPAGKKDAPPTSATVRFAGRKETATVTGDGMGRWIRVPYMTVSRDGKETIGTRTLPAIPDPGRSKTALPALISDPDMANLPRDITLDWGSGHIMGAGMGNDPKTGDSAAGDMSQSVDLSAFTVTFNGRPAPSISPARGVDSAVRVTLPADLLLTGDKTKPVADKTTVKIDVTAAFGPGCAVMRRAFDVVLKKTDDTTPPPQPVVQLTYDDMLSTARFNSPDDYSEVAERGGMSLYRQAGAGEDGSDCMLLEKEKTGNSWEAYTFLYRTNYDADRYPMIFFRYKLNPTMPRYDWRHGRGLHIGARIDREVYGIFDSYFHQGRELVDYCKKVVLADGRWHPILFDARTLLKRYQPDWADRLIVEQLFLVTRTGRSGTRCMYLDDVMIFNPASSKVIAWWRHPADTGGVIGYAWTLNRSPDSNPGNAVNLPRAQGDFQHFTLTAKQLHPGANWLHVNAVDINGNVSQTCHMPVYWEPVDKR